MAGSDQPPLLLQELQFLLRDGTYTPCSNFDATNGKISPRNFSGFRFSLAPVIPPPHKLTSTNPSNKSAPKTKPQEMVYLCYNLETAAYIYKFNGKPLYYMNFVDRKLFTSDPPVCMAATTEELGCNQMELLIATKSGSIMNFNPFSRTSVSYNEDHSIEGSKDTRPTHIAWIPRTSQIPQRFAVSFSSRTLLFFTTKYKVPGIPQSTPTIDNPHFAFYPTRTRKTFLKMKLRIGTDTLNHFSFSTDGTQIATASSDGFLRVFIIKPFQLRGKARAYFGGVLSVCWSPDEKLLATGAEDDLVTVWNNETLLPVARCFGHRSWVNSVLFDPYYIPNTPEVIPGDSCQKSLFSPSADPASPERHASHKTPISRLQSLARVESMYVENIIPTYRLGSIGQDGRLFIWEFSDSDLQAPTPNPPRAQPLLTPNSATPPPSGAQAMNGDATTSDASKTFINSTSDLEVDDSNSEHLDKRTKKQRDSKKGFKKKQKSSSSPIPTPPSSLEDVDAPLSHTLVNRLEPVLEKFVYEDRLTSIGFEKRFIVVSSHCGRIVCWERPVKELSTDVKDPNEPLENHVESNIRQKATVES